MSDSATPPTALRRALRAYLEARRRALVQARRTLDIGDGDARALLFIAENPGVRPTEIRDHLGITSAGVTATIDRLVERGIVRRDVDQADRRANRVSLTIDVREEPWSLLTRFDDDFESAASIIEAARVESFVELLEAATAAATADRR